jgi:S-adenosylmethionine hydrolase
MPSSGNRLIAFLTDFGTRDWYVATLKGIILSHAPRAQVVDITHDIPPQDVIAGAFVLASVVEWFPPETIFVAVVDPGVGSERPLLAARADQRYFIGPDNGLLSWSLERASQATIVRLTNRRYWLKDISRTFHGRDVMAPVAAHLARGVRLSQLGRPVERITKLAVPAIQRHERSVEGSILHIDAFGSLITNLPETLLRGKLSAGPVMVRYKERQARMVSSYLEGQPNELIAVVGSLRLIELAIREGSAAWVCNARRGDPVELRW